MLCDTLEGWDGEGGGRQGKEGGNACIPMAGSHYCNVIILQLKIILNKNEVYVESSFDERSTL